MRRRGKSHFCNVCEYHTASKTDFNRHLVSKKHIINAMSEEQYKEYSKEAVFTCGCRKLFKSRSGLYRHKKYCNHAEPAPSSLANSEVKEILSEVSELKNQLSAYHNSVDAKSTQQIIQNIVINNDNRNLTLVFDEKLKHVVNIEDMLKTLTFDTEFFTTMCSKMEYAESIAKVIMEKLETMNIEERPIHCIKNENDRIDILRFKNDNKWVEETTYEIIANILREDETEEEDKNKFSYVIKFIDMLLRKVIHERYKDDNVFLGKMMNMYKANFSKKPNNKFKLLELIVDMVKINADALEELVKNIGGVDFDAVNEGI
jgi:hypothetical protein